MASPCRENRICVTLVLQGRLATDRRPVQPPAKHVDILSFPAKMFIELFGRIARAKHQFDFRTIAKPQPVAGAFEQLSRRAAPAPIRCDPQIVNPPAMPVKAGHDSADNPRVLFRHDNCRCDMIQRSLEVCKRVVPRTGEPACFPNPDRGIAIGCRCRSDGDHSCKRSARSLWNRTSSPSASHFASAAIAPSRSISGSISLLW